MHLDPDQGTRPGGDEGRKESMKTTDLRKRLFMTQLEFAEFLGVDVRCVQNWDARGSFPDWASRIFDEYVIPQREIIRGYYSISQEERERLPFPGLEEDPDEEQYIRGWNVQVKNGRVVSVDLTGFRLYPFIRSGSSWVIAPLGVDVDKVEKMLKSDTLRFR